MVERNSQQWDSIIDRCYKIMNMTEAHDNCTGEFWCNCKKVDTTNAS